MVKEKGSLRMQAKGNILFVANYESDVGYAWWLMENYWVEISKFFYKRNRLCFLIYPKITKLPKNILDSPIHVLEHDFSDRSKHGRERLRRIISDNNISSIYLTDRKYYDIFYLLLRLWGVKVIINHDHSPGERTPVPVYKNIFKKLIHSFEIFSCDYYIGVSKFVYNRFINCGCIPSSKCFYVLNGIVPIEINDQFRFYAHEKFNIPKDAIILVTTGRATFYKGIDFLIRCANLLINESKEDNLYFIHCGDGPDLITFKQMVKDYNLNNRFIFAGRRSDVPEILQSCDIGIQASKGEAFSLSILEYMSAGLATMVPDHCGNSEAINHGVNGLLYKPEDVQSLMGHLKNIIRDRDLRSKIGSSAGQTVREKFSINKCNIELIKIVSDKL